MKIGDKTTRSAKMYAGTVVDRKRATPAVAKALDYRVGAWYLVIECDDGKLRIALDPDQRSPQNEAHH